MSKMISTNELKDLQRNKEGFALVNVLSEEDFRKSNIAGSKNAPVDRPDFLKNIEGQTGGDKKKRVVVYCAGAKCDASTRAAKMLTDAGYTNIEEYRGGMEEWNASSSGGRGQHNAGGAKQGERGNAGEKHRPQESDSSRSTEKSSSREGSKGAAAPQVAGTSSSTNRPSQGSQASSDRGPRDNSASKHQTQRDAGDKDTGPGLKTGVPHPDVMQPQVRTDERKVENAGKNAPRPAMPGQSGQQGAGAPAQESSSKS